MENYRQWVGLLPALGEPWGDVKIGVALEQAVEKQIVDVF